MFMNRAGKNLLSYGLIIIGGIFILIWIPKWIWFVIIGTILIIAGINIYKK